MSDIDPPPRAAAPFITFVALLRANGFAVAPEQTTAFLSAIVLLGPRDPEVARLMTLRMGGTEEEADQVARFWEEENRKNGYTLDKAS